VEKMGSAMLEEMERLLQRMRSGKTSRDLTGWYRDLARRYELLLNACMALGLEPTIVARLKEKWKEVTIEAGRLFKK
jgi:aspartyl/asparaginyl-tRNA synthetase